MKMKQVLVKLLKFILLLYIIVCAGMYFFQESFIFHPEELDENYEFNFKQPFREVLIEVEDDVNLHGLFFPADSAKGVILYLHGNAGSVKRFGNVAKTYTDLNYDVFMPDYRGFGKSDGSIYSQEQFFTDIQIVYDELKDSYNEENIVVIGFSIGTGPAAKLASQNNPKLLILQAPYYSLTDMMRSIYPVIPTFLLKYKFDTYRYLEECRMPVVIFHGTSDKTVSYRSSLKLREHFKEQDTLITLPGHGHNGMRHNEIYKAAIGELLQ